MTNRYTQSEWRAIIDQAEKDHSNSAIQYKTPTIGSLDFAKCIDHSLLKLEATRDQIDQLCEEAVRYDFKVGGKDSLDYIIPSPTGSISLFLKNLKKKSTSNLQHVEPHTKFFAYSPFVCDLDGLIELLQI